MTKPPNKSHDYTKILTEMKEELTAIKNQNVATQNDNKTLTKMLVGTSFLLVGTSFLLVAFGIAQIATFGTNHIFFIGNLTSTVLGILFSVFTFMGFVFIGKAVISICCLSANLWFKTK